MAGDEKMSIAGRTHLTQPILPRRQFLRGGATLGLVTMLGRPAIGQTADATVETAHGKVRGRSAGGVQIFKGIPYAASTGGKNRFLPPQPVQPWTDIRDAFDYGPTAPQVIRTTGAPIVQPIGEDCLVLNVFTPSTDTGKGRPVMVWLHGGGWRVGSGSGITNDGTHLAAFGDVVVVSINHRLNLFGHLQINDPDDRFADSGNGGVLDMVAALRWVRDNIAAFGGDPGNVTIFGVSGGGSKVAALMATPAARGLFHKAIAQSCSGNLRITGQEEAARRAHDLAKTLGLAKLSGQALQDVPFDRLCAALTATAPSVNAYRPIVDGRTFDRHPFDPDAPALSAHIPMIAGNMATETTAELAHDKTNFTLDAKEVQRRLTRYLQVDSGTTQTILSAYRDGMKGASPSDLLVAITTDYQYLRNTRRMASLQARSGKAPVYSYIFNWRTPVMDGLLKSPHGSDVPFVFGTTAAAARTLGTGADLTPMSRIMMATWTSFARTGKPDNALIPHWPRFDDDRGATMMFGLPSRVENNPGGALRASLDRLPYYEYDMPINFDEA